MSDTRKRAHITSSFTDAGTGENFEKGAQPLLDPGTYNNYEAAGLVEAPPPATTPASAKPKATAKKAARKAPAKPASKPAATTSADTAATPSEAGAAASE